MPGTSAGCRAASAMSGWPMIPAARLRVFRTGLPSPPASPAGVRDHLALLVARRKQLQDGSDHADRSRPPYKGPTDPCRAAQQVERAHRRHDEAPVTTAPPIVCTYCQSAHGFSSSAQKLVEQNLPVRSARVADRMLHPRVGRDDEVARKPRADEHQERRQPVPDLAQPLLAEQEQPQESSTPGRRRTSPPSPASARSRRPPLRKSRPVGAELEFHRDSGDDAEREVDAENPRPEARRAIVVLVVGAQRQRLRRRSAAPAPS